VLKGSLKKHKHNALVLWWQGKDIHTPWSPLFRGEKMFSWGSLLCEEEVT